jgi:GH18 family chitinase
MDKAQASLDFVNLMTYDMAGDWDPVTAHHSPLFTNPASPKGQSCAPIRRIPTDAAWDQGTSRRRSIPNRLVQLLAAEEIASGVHNRVVRIPAIRGRKRQP